MEPRIALNKVGTKPIQLLQQLEGYIHDSGLDPKLIHLVKMRASQINGCAYCIDMHWKDARADGETEQRLYGLDAWEESPYYTPRERAALAWTESVTLLKDHVPDAVYRSVKEHFNEQELANLTLAVAMINVWNRLTIPLRVPAGTYQPRKLR
jgi:AhpD family alkylhydroperoxidase